MISRKTDAFVGSALRPVFSADEVAAARARAEEIDRYLRRKEARDG